MSVYEGVFELFEVKVRRLQNGNKLRLVFEAPENKQEEKDLIDFRGERVKAIITQSVQPQEKSDTVTIRDNFEVFELKCRRLKNGDKLSLILEQMYNKAVELDAVKLRYDDCKISLETIEQELDFEGSEEEEEEDAEAYAK